MDYLTTQRKMYSSITFFLSMVFLIVTSGTAQNVNIVKKDLSNTRDLKSESLFYEKSSTKVIGTPYLNDDFLKGKIITNEPTTTKAIYLRYNIFENNVEFIRDGNTLKTDASKIDGFLILTDQNNIVFKNGFKSSMYDINTSKFLRIIKNGKMKLLALHKVNRNKNLASFNTASKTNKYTTHTSYYILSEDHFIKINTSEGDFDGMDPNLSKKVANFSKKNNLSFKNEDDLKKIVSYYNKIK